MAPEMPSKEVDGPSEGVKEPCKRARNHEGDAFSASQADRLRNQFPKTTWMALRIAKERASAVAWARMSCACCHLPVGDFGIVGQSRLAQGPDGQARQRDAHLDAGNDAVEIREELFNDLCLRTSLGHQLATRDSRTATNENSTAAKKPFSATRTRNSDEPDKEHTGGENPQAAL